MVITDYILPISIFLGFFLSAIWLVFFLLEDKKKPEPKSAITKTFILGMVSALVAAGIGRAFLYVAPILGILDYSIMSISVHALIEELIKFLVVFVFISQTRHFNEPIDRIIYMITAALGFAVVENFFFIMNATSIAEIIKLSVFRFIGATLMHSLSSGILGSMWAKGKLFFGIILATIIHVIFNLLILDFGPKFYPIVFLILVAFVLFYQFDIMKTYYYEKQTRRK